MLEGKGEARDDPVGLGMDGRMAKNETQEVLLCYRRGFYFNLLVNTQFNLFIVMHYFSFHIFNLLSPPLALPTLPRK